MSDVFKGLDSCVLRTKPVPVDDPEAAIDRAVDAMARYLVAQWLRLKEQENAVARGVCREPE